MDFIIQNWYIILAGIAVVGGIIYACIRFFKLPRAEQIAAIKEWLLSAVIKAEKELGSGTGQAKLAFVYDLFISKFPAISLLIPFETFSNYVDEALDKMREMLETTPQLQQYIDAN